MNLRAYFRSLTARFFQGTKIAADMEEELRSHIQHRADDLEHSGLDRAEAERRVRIEFGGYQRFKEESRKALSGNFLETLVSDVRFSLRLLRKSPGFSIAAVFTLALAIGANAVVFGVLNGLILRQLNAPQADSLFGIEHGKLTVSPDASVYTIALVLALASGLMFGIVPVRQVLRANPYQIIKAGSSETVGRRITLRELLLVAQIAICAVLVTASMVAIRGLMLSLHANFGFEPRDAMLLETDLNMAGYRGDRLPEMQRRMIDAVKTIPGVESVGLIGRTPLYGGGFGAFIFSDRTTDLRPSNAMLNAVRFNISPEYFRAARTDLLAGRAFSRHDDKDSSRVAVVNREFARKIFGSTTNAVGGRFKLRDGRRIQVVGVVNDGIYEPYRRSHPSAVSPHPASTN
jgi:ABC-type antimicrobial peptide transport system permease subunit